jgi:DNA-binding IclR family transcriptional regulator
VATSEAPNSNAGVQTLARGLRALELIANAPGGLTIQEVADQLGVHRSIANRLIGTIAEFRLISRGSDGRFRPAGGLTALARQVYTGLRDTARPVMQDLADRVGWSVALFVEEGLDAVAVTVAEPANSAVRVAYREGARHPLDRGAAAYALLTTRPARATDDAHVTEARRNGYATSFGEVVEGYWGLSVPLDLGTAGPAACLNLITASKDAIDDSVDAMVRAAADISQRMR